MSELGIRSYRFSISWPRVQPTGIGQPNAKGLDFYKRLVEALREKDIKPMATLFHWDLPEALQSGPTGNAGWESRDTAYRFADFATIVYEALGDIVPTFCTINEPKTVVYVGYISGQHAPGVRSEARAWVAAHHLMLGHGLAVQALDASGKPAKIGPALGLGPTYPASDTERAQAAARANDGREIRFWLDAVLRGEYPADTVAYIDRVSPMTSHIRGGDMKIISTPIDMVGVQYYGPAYVDDNGAAVVRRPTSEAGWQQIYPEGLYDVLTRIKKEYGDIPIVVTENGIPMPDVLRPDGHGGPDTVDDSQRIAFLRDHLAAANRAIRADVRLIGYHVWSLLDNFEWAWGYEKRFGIVHVDYDTLVRTIKDSGHALARIAKESRPALS